MRISNTQTPVVKLGTKLSQGVVIGILNGKLEVLGEAGVQSLTFTQVEKEIFSC
jgi:hypothetical protein